MRSRLARYLEVTGCTHHAVAIRARVERAGVVRQVQGKEPVAPEVLRAAKAIAADARDQRPGAFGPSVVEAISDHRRRLHLAQYLAAPGNSIDLVARRARVTADEIERQVSGAAMVSDEVLTESKYCAGCPVFARHKIQAPPPVDDGW